MLLDVNENLSDEKIINYIFSKIIDSDDFIDYSLKLLNKIKSTKIKKKFFQSIKNNIIELEDFISDKNNKKLILYISLDKNKLLDEDTEYYKQNKKFLDKMKEKLNNFGIKNLRFNHF